MVELEIGSVHTAMQLMNEILKQSDPPKPETLRYLVKRICQERKNLSTALPDAITTYLDHMKRLDFPIHQELLNMALDALSKQQFIDQMLQLFHTMESKYGVKPESVAYNTVISALGHVRRVDEALKMYNQAPEHIQKDQFTINAIIHAYATVKDIPSMEEV